MSVYVYVCTYRCMYMYMCSPSWLTGMCRGFHVGLTAFAGRAMRPLGPAPAKQGPQPYCLVTIFLNMLFVHWGAEEFMVAVERRIQESDILNVLNDSNVPDKTWGQWLSTLSLIRARKRLASMFQRTSHVINLGSFAYAFSDCVMPGHC